MVEPTFNTKARLMPKAKATYLPREAPLVKPGIPTKAVTSSKAYPRCRVPNHLVFRDAAAGIAIGPQPDQWPSCKGRTTCMATLPR